MSTTAKMPPKQHGPAQGEALSSRISRMIALRGALDDGGDEDHDCAKQQHGPVILRQRQSLEHGTRPQLRQVQVGHGFGHHAHGGAEAVGNVKVIADEHDHERAQHGKHLIPRALALDVQSGDDFVRHRLQQRGHEMTMPFRSRRRRTSTRAVPDADDEKRDQQATAVGRTFADVAAGCCLAWRPQLRMPSRSTAGKTIVAQPVAERDVPAVPVLGECARSTGGGSFRPW